MNRKKLGSDSCSMSSLIIDCVINVNCNLCFGCPVPRLQAFSRTVQYKCKEYVL